MRVDTVQQMMFYDIVVGWIITLVIAILTPSCRREISIIFYSSISLILIRPSNAFLNRFFIFFTPWLASRSIRLLWASFSFLIQYPRLTSLYFQSISSPHNEAWLKILFIILSVELATGRHPANSRNKNTKAAMRWQERGGSHHTRGTVLLLVDVQLSGFFVCVSTATCTHSILIFERQRLLFHLSPPFCARGAVWKEVIFIALMIHFS